MAWKIANSIEQFHQAKRSQSGGFSHIAAEDYITFVGRFDGLAMLGVQRN
jgi:hypothetical protein